MFQYLFSVRVCVGSPIICCDIVLQWNKSVICWHMYHCLCHEHLFSHTLLFSYKTFCIFAPKRMVWDNRESSYCLLWYPEMQLSSLNCIYQIYPDLTCRKTILYNIWNPVVCSMWFLLNGIWTCKQALLIWTLVNQKTYISLWCHWLFVVSIWNFFQLLFYTHWKWVYCICHSHLIF